MITHSYVSNISKFTDKRVKMKYGEDILFSNKFTSTAKETGKFKREHSNRSFESMSHNKEQHVDFLIRVHIHILKIHLID